MKTILATGLYLLLGFVFCFSMDSQRPVIIPPTPEELAHNQTEVMSQELSLTSEQKAKVGEINLKYAKQFAAIKTPDPTKLHNDRMAELGKIFTAEQSQKWQDRRTYLLNLVKSLPLDPATSSEGDIPSDWQ